MEKLNIEVKENEDNSSNDLPFHLYLLATLSIVSLISTSVNGTLKIDTETKK